MPEDAVVLAAALMRQAPYISGGKLNMRKLITTGSGNKNWKKHIHLLHMFAG